MKRLWTVMAALAALIALSSSQQDGPILEWIPMGDGSVTVPAVDDGATEVTTPIGFRFGESIHHNIYVVTNGLISFDTPYTFWFNQPFPGFVSNLYLIAPFWDDVDIRFGSGTISYEIHTSGEAIETVSEYIRQRSGTNFEGYWMMVVFWDSVHQYFYSSSDDENSFQAILITDANQNTYAIFIYECGLMQWDNTATIGYNAGPDHYDNHDPSGNEVACVNVPANNFSNVFYQLHEAEPLPTEPAQTSYLDFLPHTTTTISSGFLQACDDCSSPEITLPGDFPFGNYYHQTAYLGANGIISMRREYSHFNPQLFPTTVPDIYWGFAAAPFWSDVDLRLEGSASWEIHTMAQSENLINMVSTFIQENLDSGFSGQWLMVGYWENVHPFPHGLGFTNPFLQNNNTFQAILITNGTKSYAVYTYKCGEMQWGDESTIGFNAGADYYENHPITGHFQAHFIACLQNDSGSVIKNEIYDLVPDPSSLIPGAIPPYHNTIGSCADAGFTECCNSGDCRGLPLAGSCYCDGLCSLRGDCCYDQQDICPTGLLTDDYLLVADDSSIHQMSLNGSNFETIFSDVNGRAYGIDYHIAGDFMVWSDVEQNKIYRMNLHGTGLVTEIVTTEIAAVDDVAVDWIANNLYWADAVWARIEVMNLDTLDRAVVLRTGANTNPRAIAVDPTTRYMYWTELGAVAKIERAYMDGSGRQILIGFGLVQPNGLTIDIAEQRLYWCDTAADVISYAVVDSTGIQEIVNLESESSSLVQPFALTVSSTSVFWSDLDTTSVYATHKLHGTGGDEGLFFTVYAASGSTPRGLEVVSSDRQPTSGIENPCNGSGCSHICMLTGDNDQGFTCACPENYDLDDTGLICQMVSTPSPTPPPEGSCSSAGYTTCCEHGSCGGNPATCFCDEECYVRFDCCSDMQDICNEVPPLIPTDIRVEITTTTATVFFTIPFIVYDSEQYQVQYGLSMDTLIQSSQSVSSIDGNDQEYMILIENLQPGTTYFFQVTSTNSIATTTTGIISGTTMETAPSGPPQNFTLSVDNTTLILSWQQPVPENRNGVIISYTVSCTSDGGSNIMLTLGAILEISLYESSPDTTFTCQVAASTSVGIGPYSDVLMGTTGGIATDLIYIPWVQMGVLFDSTQVFLPATDDGFVGPIQIPPGFPFGSSVQTQVFVGTNGLISFGTGYNSFSNQPFPGSTFISSRYLVAPFWDDVDIRFNTGEISYEIHDSGYFLNKVNMYIQRRRPTSFVGTWMMVVYYDAVHPYFGLFNPQENTFQAILITDGNYSYTIFTYQCGLMGWDRGATIGFNAGGEFFANNDPSSAEVACLNVPDSDWSNIIFLLSTANPESPPPSSVTFVDISLSAATVQWVVASISEQQQYTVQYGTDPNNLNMTIGPISSGDNPMATDLMFEQVLSGLTQGTTYYVQVVSTFNIYTLSSDVISFETLEPVPGVPTNFAIVASGTVLSFSWSQPVGDEVIVSYRLVCGDTIDLEFGNIEEITLYDLEPETTYMCTLAAASSGGYGSATNETSATTGDAVAAESYFPFVPMGVLLGVEQIFLPATDDGVLGPIDISVGFPFGSSNQTQVYIGTNGLLSFGTAYNSFSNQPLPISTLYLVAPYWDDIDIRFGRGQISYEIHQSGYFLDEVSEFIRRRRPSQDFQGTWMMVVLWDAVHPYFGLFNPEENTFQAILITDGTYSYTMFTYNCELTEWDNGVTIGYSAGGEPFDNYDPSSREVACLNQPFSNYSNVIYLLSDASPEIPPPQDVDVSNITLTSAEVAWRIPYIFEMESYTVEYGLSSSDLNQVSNVVLSPNDPTVIDRTYSVLLQGLTAGTLYYARVRASFGTGELYVRYSDVISFFTQTEPQNAYLLFLDHTDTNIASDTLLTCDDCSSLEITLPSDFPFGGYYHQSVFVSTNGFITFGAFLLNSEPELFPTTDADTFWTFMVAPFWADFDTTLGGTVSWEIHDSANSPSLLMQVDDFIRDEYGDTDFSGTWMLVAFWENVQPSELDNGNTFQAILTTNSTKSYAVFTYKCGELQWSDPAVIGYNIPPGDVRNHFLSSGLSGMTPTDEIACLHANSMWSNVIFELEISNVILPVTPEPHFAIGSCVEAGFTGCCTSGTCFVQPGFCYCDFFCHFFGDCCYDIDDTCPFSDGTQYDILVGHNQHISQVHFEGTSFETVRTNTTGTVVGVDALIANSLMFWSDITTDTIHRANLNGSGEEIIADTCIGTVDDIAVDWISNKLYWADAVLARIEAIDLVSLVRVEVLRTGDNTRPRAIAVDPLNRVMFWTDYGITAKIETAAMDGMERRTLHFTDLSQPNGITIDYATQRIYWSDSALDKLEFSGFDGSDRTVIESVTSGLLHPFAVTVADDLIFWSDWETNTIYATHKEHGALENGGFFAEIATFLDTPYGIEALQPARQPASENPCLASECSHMCLLTFVNEAGFNCACPEGFEFENATFCKPSEGETVTCFTDAGTCAVNFDSCCELESGFCVGYPPTCFCDADCRLRGDCCSDINDTCAIGTPRTPREITVSNITASTATVSWLIPYISAPEEYTVEYGLSSDNLEYRIPTPPISSGDNTSVIDQWYSTTIEGLTFVTIYYFRVIASNNAGTVASNILSFRTPEGAPSAPPANFTMSITDTKICLSWDPPPESEQNGVIISFTVICTKDGESSISHQVKNFVRNFCADLYLTNQDFTCSVLASTAAGDGPTTDGITMTTESTRSDKIPFASLNETFGVNQVLLPESDDGTSGPIPLPEDGFPFWSTTRTRVYVGTNGLLSFDTAYNSWFNRPFPGFVSFRYLVAPFWDDVDIRGGNGEISYEIHESGYFLDHVSAFIRSQRPSEFQGTWMMFAFWDAVHPYFGASNPEENTFQAILITDGTYTYTIFTYDCSLTEWGTSVTIGFNAGGETFENNEYTTSAIACSSLPYSNLTNVVYRLSNENPEYSRPQNVEVYDILPNSVTVSWVVPSVIQQQQYYVIYGLSPLALSETSETVDGMDDITLTDQQYSVGLTGLTDSTMYYFRVVAEFGDIVLMSDINTFRTQDQPPSGPPDNFTATVDRVSISFSWDVPPLGNGLLVSYTLTCVRDGEQPFSIVLNPIQQFTLEELNPSTAYTCSIFGTTSGGSGPAASITVTTADITVDDVYLPFVVVGVAFGVEAVYLPASDEGVEGPISITTGFPFGSSVQNQVYVGTNGILSFGSPYGSFFNQQFPGSSTINFRYLVAPFWDDVDTRFDSGQISYEIHQSGYFLDGVNEFLRKKRPSTFEGTWMMVAHWEAVNQYFALFNSQENTFQAILITDGNYSYTIFSYKCGLMEWGTSATIGFNAAGEMYANYDSTTAAVACSSVPDSDYTNIIYRLSNESPEIPLPQDVVVTNIMLESATVSWRIPSFAVQEQYYVEYGTDPDNLLYTTEPISSPMDTSLVNQTYQVTLQELNSTTVYYVRVRAVFNDVYVRYSETVPFVTKEQAQTQYISGFLLANQNSNVGTLPACDDCTSPEITLPGDFPFGGYFHQTAYISTNGLISFGRSVTNSAPVLFPSDDAFIYWSYIVAPFWADFDTTQGGFVTWRIYESSVSPVEVAQVSNFIQEEYGDDDFTGTWMLVGYWDSVQTPDAETTDFEFSFEAMLITDGSKSYAVFTYLCEDQMWSGSATIGFNAPQARSNNHFLSGLPIADQVACLQPQSEWKNLIYDLEINTVILPVTPAPSQFLGSCVEAGFTECCTGGDCTGRPVSDCYCDSSCFFFGDCCSDIDQTCTTGASYDILVGHGHHISQVHFEGTNYETIRTNTTGTVVGVDFYYERSKMLWSDVTTDTIHRADMTGDGEEILVDTNLIAVDDIAVDWVSGKLYWTDAGWARIEAMDLDSLVRVEVLRTGTNTAPRGIAVDPERRVMYWTDWGRTARIEQASMDGSERRDFINTDLSQPNGISIDYQSGRVYWSDADLDKLEFASYDSTGRTLVETVATGLLHPFAVSVGDNTLFWSDWATNTIYATHKEHGADDNLGYFAAIASFPTTPYGVEVILPNRQTPADNPCEGNTCSHVCLLSLTGFTCACPEGYYLDTPTLCKITGGGTSPTPPPDGTCAAAGYEYCCEHGFCAGYPATCYCDNDCFQREDCCSDIADTCVEGSPRAPRDVTVSSVTADSAVIRWTIPYIASTQETYVVTYGLDPDSLTSATNPIISGPNVSIVYTQSLSNLDPLETYYFRVVATNDAGSAGTDIFNFMTLSGPPTGPPLNFDVQVDGTAMSFTWDPPAESLQNGDIVSYTMSCSLNSEIGSSVVLGATEQNFTIDLFAPGTTFQCQVYATNAFGDGPPANLDVTTDNIAVGSALYLSFLNLGLNQVFLPESDDGTSGAIPLPDFPFWSTSRTQVYVGTNGLLSFDSPYNSWSNQVFPGFVSFRYLVAPFWDDVDIRGGNGRISYEIYESGYFLDHVSAFIRAQKPSEFQGTWMMVVFWDAVHPYFGASRPEENSYQAILITDGTYTYTVFTYDCSLTEWGTSATIGFNAGGEAFENNVFTTSAIACSSLPNSNVTNVIYRLSLANPEYPPAQNVELTDISLNTVTVSWVVPYFQTWQQYSVVYGTQPDALDFSWGVLYSPPDTSLVNQTYSTTVQGLTQGTVYYMRVSSTFGFNIIYSDLVSFRTLDPAPDGPPQEFVINVIGTTLDFSWQPPAEEVQNGLIMFYSLSCSVNGEEVFSFELEPVLGITLDDFRLNSLYVCSLSASTSGGAGPSASASATTEVVEDIYLPFVPVGSVRNTNYVQLPESDDGTSGGITMPLFPFGNSNQSTAYVGTNGLLSFGTSYNSWSNQPFPGSFFVSSRYLVAPFWDDVDIRGGNGQIFYEIHESGYFLDQVNKFLQARRPSAFQGTWMMVAYWDAVHPYFGAFNPEENTFQAILITDGSYSYTIFTYQCGLMEWDNGATIGYSAAGNPYVNNDPSSSEVACLNQPDSDYTNLIFLLSNESPEIPLPDMVTVSNIMRDSASVSWRIPSFIVPEQYYVEYGTDPDNLDQRTNTISSPVDTSVTNMMYTAALELNAGTVYYIRVAAVYNFISKRVSEMIVFRTKENEQVSYLPFLPHTDSNINSSTLEACNDCSSSEIILPFLFPFGGYFHQTAFINTNGAISFGQAFSSSDPEIFPPTSSITFWSYLAAPFWADINTTQSGSVSWEIHDNSDSPELLGQVDSLIQQEYGDTTFNSLWMLIGFWENVQFTDQQETDSTFQAILTTNGTKSYAVYTYKCGELMWSGPVAIGYNAPPNDYYNHPITEAPLSADEIACVHQDSEWNNVIIDVQSSNVILPTTPDPHTLTGSCRDAGFTECCTTFPCVGTPVGSPPCFCDFFCVFFGDCCFDADATCHAPTYDLLVGNGDHVSLVHFEGTTSVTVRTNTTGNVVGVDFYADKSLMFWSDTERSTIHQANLDGTNEQILVDSDIRVVDDIAVDWVANNLYWVDSVWARIEAMNIDTLERTEVLVAGANTRPRAIAVDPLNTIMFWTDWGQTAKIERAFMDGEDRRVLHDVGLSQPNGITIDYAEQKIYWSDADLDKLEYSNYDGSGRTLLETEADGLLHPFALTIAGELLFWTDWETNYLYFTHKQHGNTEGLGLFESLAHFTSQPFGVEALDPSRQLPAENPCAESNCSHVCLLSATSEGGYTCACPEGARLEGDDKTCEFASGAGPVNGSCVEAGYTTCCSHGFCSGRPATCSCNPDCYNLGDCCNDIDDACPRALPQEPNVELIYLTHISAVIQWTVPIIVFSSEQYTLQYGIDADQLNMESQSIFSGTDISVQDQVYSVRLEGLSPATTYYYRVQTVNTHGTTYTEVLSFSTPYVGPPQNFTITVGGTETLTFSWDLPLEITLDEIDYFAIECNPRFQNAITEIVVDFMVTLQEFLPGTTYTCTVAAKTDELGAPATQTATTDEAPTNLPFLVLGNTPGVQLRTLPPSDDANSAPIYIAGGMPLGSTTQTIAFVGTNGIISFNQEWLFWDPDPFPTSNFYIHNSYVLAPFWADVDTRVAGSVFYEVHQRGANTDSNAVLERVSGFIAQQMNVNFTGSWMLVAQWDRVHPFPHGSQDMSDVSEEYNAFLESENTYQAIVITDGSQSLVMYVYQCELMGWSGQGDGFYATIGYNLNGQFVNHPLTATAQASNIACLSQDVDVNRRQASRWHNQIYQLPIDEDPVQQLRSQCFGQRIQDIQTQGDIMPLASSIPACPPSLLQAVVDFRFVLYTPSITATSRCYIQAFPTGNSGISAQYCCYSTRSGSYGAQLTGDLEGSSMLLYHPTFFPNESAIYDQQFKETCCAVGLCDVFYERRPLNIWTDYVPPFFAFALGDPHITTLDGKTYTFNGRGEYILVRALETGFMFQGRTEPVSDTSNATQFSAFAMGMPAQGLSAEVRIERNRLVVFVNGEDVSSSIAMVNSTSIVGGAFLLTRIGENSVRILLYQERVSYVLTVTQRQDILDFVLNLEESLKGTTRGLFGNFNDDSTDDLIYPNGIRVPLDATDEMLHEFGQSWRITEEESLFTYPVGTTHADYDFPDHSPPYLGEVVANAPQEIIDMCNNNEQCIFDAVQTNNPEIGTGTLSTIENNNMDIMQANNFPPMLNGSNTFRVNIGETSLYSFTATDEGDITIAVQGPQPGTYTFTVNANMRTFAWTVMEASNDSVSFVATDSLNATSTLSPRVEMCACQNGGSCTLDGILGIDGNTIIMRCECPPAWEGEFCEQDLDGCAELSCFQGVQCYDIPAPGIGAACDPCPVGYTGDGEKCADIDECNSTNNCQQVCSNTPGSYMCSCRDGYQVADTPTACEDVDECTLGTHNCQQVCSNTGGSFTCDCFNGYTLADDQRSCTANMMCPENSCSHSCAVVNGNPVCSCPQGYTLASDDITCTDIDECQDNVCEQTCTNSVGSFQCGCNSGYTLSSNQRNCNDVDECVESALSGSPACPVGLICQNTVGSFTCDCPAGTMRNAQDECEPIEIPKPSVVVLPTTSFIPTETPTSISSTAKDHSVVVTLGISNNEFTEARQQDFKQTIADGVTKYCQENSKECQGVTIKQRREAFVVTSKDVVLTDIASNADNRVTFTMYVLVNDGFEVLHVDALEASVNSVQDELTRTYGSVSVKPFVGESGGDSGGLSGGAAAGIAIVVILVVVAVLAITAVILYQLRRRGSYKINAISNLTMGDIFRPRRSSMLIDESTYEEGKLEEGVSSAKVSSSKAAEAKAEEAEKEKEPFEEDVKVNEFAEEAV